MKPDTTNGKILNWLTIYGFKKLSSSVRSILSLPRFLASILGQSKNLAKRYPAITSAEYLAKKHTPPSVHSSRTLDLGCGTHPCNPFNAEMVFGVDVRKDLDKTIRYADLSSEPIPFDSNLFDFCTAYDVIEHIPRESWNNGAKRMAFLELFNEIYRVLKPGGLFLHSTPAYPSKEAFQDPTHVNVITEDTMPNYFCMPHNWAKTHGYGFEGRFELVEQGWVNHVWLVSIMKALK